MQPFTQHTGLVAAMDRANVDTDQIIPARFLKVTDKHGLGDSLFCDWRYLKDGSPNPYFVLNRPESQGAQILIAGANFGSGPSREHAPWALVGWGFRAIISTGFADIFKSNSLKNGLLPVTVEEEVANWLLEHPDTAVKIDIGSRSLEIEGYGAFNFPLDPFSAYCLARGIDQLDFILQAADDIRGYEQEHGK